MPTSAQDLINKVDYYVINPIIYVLFAFGLFMFVYGVVEFMHALSKGGSKETLDQGRGHMLWGVIGMFIMVSVFGIMHLISNFFGFGLGPQGTYNPDMSVFNNLNAQLIHF